MKPYSLHFRQTAHGIPSPTQQYTMQSINKLMLQTEDVVITYDKKVMFSLLFVCFSVCLLATLRKNFRTDLHEIFREGWQWANEQIK